MSLSASTDDALFTILKTLCELPGPVGNEKAVHQFLLERWTPYCQDVHITPVGNLVAHIGGNGPKLLLLGHGDEICFTVRHISEEGFLFLSSGQRLATDRPEMRGSYSLPTGQSALVVTEAGTVEGVFATLTGHILSQQQREVSQLEWRDLWVDVCAVDRSDAEAMGISIGDRIIWNPPTRRKGKFIYGKAMDNRAALAVLDVLVQNLDQDKLQYDVYVGSSVQEEIGLIGAHSINRSIGADYAISLDIGLSGDVPGVDPRDVSVRLGAGPTLIHKDLYAYDLELSRAIRRTAHEENLPLQQAVFGVFGSDSGALLREGVAAALIGIPTRYTHSPFEMLHEDDLRSTIGLLQTFLEKPHSRTDSRDTP